MDKKKKGLLAMLGLAVLALALTFIPVPGKNPAPTPVPPTPTTALAFSPTEPATEPVVPSPTEPVTATPRSCTEPEKVLVATTNQEGTPIPPPIGEGGVFKIEAAPCTRELALRDFAEIYRFWSNADGNPFKRKPGYEEREEFFVEGQPAGEMWRFNTQWYAENKSAYAVWDPRGYEPERVRAVYQDPNGTTVWVFYDRSGVEVPVKRLSDDSVIETSQGGGLMRWMLWWQAGQYKAVAYEAKDVRLP
jgi:hypothetical protein